MSWYDRVPNNYARGLGVIDVTADLCTGTPRTCPRGEHAICDSPRSEYLDGVLVGMPRQWVCVPDDPLEMIFPPGAPPCPVGRAFRSVTANTGVKGPWTCPNFCTNGRSAILTQDLRWQCPTGSSPKPATLTPSTSQPGQTQGQPGQTQGQPGQQPQEENSIVTDENPIPWTWIITGVGITLLGSVVGYYYWRKK